jgi:hypothetical protein
MIETSAQNRSERTSEPSRAKRLHDSYRNSGEVLVRETEKLLLEVARKEGLDPETARDVVQTVYCSLYGLGPGVGRDIEDLDCWLTQAARYESRKWRPCSTSGAHRPLLRQPNHVDRLNNWSTCGFGSQSCG